MSLSLRQVLNSNATDLNDVTQRVTVSELGANVLKTRMTATENKAITQQNQINGALVSITNNAGQINAVNAAK
jgi:membrane carboxypeptidase/penicillin-binding protein